MADPTTEAHKQGGLEEAAKHADCCVDREEMAEQAREIERLRADLIKMAQAATLDIRDVKRATREAAIKDAETTCDLFAERDAGKPPRTCHWWCHRTVADRLRAAAQETP
jgi:hypothetical protein